MRFGDMFSEHRKLTKLLKNITEFDDIRDSVNIDYMTLCVPYIVTVLVKS